MALVLLGHFMIDPNGFVGNHLVMKYLFIFLVALTSLTSEARMTKSWTYQELLQKSDLVAIATPVESTKDTTEVSELPNLPYIDKKGQHIGFKVIGVESKMKIAVTFKGKSSGKDLVLHHYRSQDSEMAQIDGPELASFDVRNLNRRHSYLLFLIKEKDGRYAPTTGQTDPIPESIIELPVDSDSELSNLLNKQSR